VRSPQCSRRSGASRPCSMPLAFLEFPSELSPLGEPCPLSRAFASLWVRVRRSPARFPRALHPTFTACADPLPRLALRLAGTHGPGRRIPVRLDRSVEAPKRLDRKRPCSSKPGSPVNRRHAHFEALLPPRVRSRGDSYPGRGGRRRVGALLGFFPSRACSTIARDTTRRERDTQTGQGPFRMKLGNPDVPRRSRHPDSDPGF